ncbi:3-keto-disaccharide hydrolase [Fulvivirga lutimaris]|uniref:3-keto-disaccharide hydrolase n=1 Tax=Fulvivirga lutimaris TaxID=1819566 RepID=UPI0012BD064C|nr:DUF1080 domain-containing protein [Fulvivirga lutimaris]MTI40722.1 DUF1080 domain-containing protein [Fulvivirga lutimaris]
MIRQLVFLLIVVCLVSCKKEEQENWIQLFNGKDLQGWTPKIAGYPVGENYKNTFSVEEGILKVKYNEYDSFNNEFGHLFFEKPYSHYRLRAEYRFTGEQIKGSPIWGYKNNGFMLHGQTPESMTLDQYFPISLEMQLKGTNREENAPNGNLCTPGTTVQIDGKYITEHCYEGKGPKHYQDDWVTAEIIVYGDSVIHHLINGDTVLTYYSPKISFEESPDYKSPNPDGRLSSGTISIQAESHPTEFRKIELLDLSK